jgi:hypothetical protein
MVASRPTKWMVSKQRWLNMIDLLNRIGFKQIAFGGEGGGGGGGARECLRHQITLLKTLHSVKIL